MADANDPASEFDSADWIKRFRAYVESHKPLEQEVDDGRDAIYPEAVRDFDSIEHTSCKPKETNA